MDNNKKNETCGFGKKKCKPGYCPKPTNKRMYKKIKYNVIRSSNKWPSRYSSYDLVNSYITRGGKYHCKRCSKKFSFGDGGCGCGCTTCRCSSFGAPFESFYPPGAQKNTFLTPEVKKCLNIVYGPEDSSYTSSSYTPDIQNSLGFGKKSVIRYLKSLI
jgi:hypothetical protein